MMSGEITAVAIIPIGANVPKHFMLIGAVNDCAPVLAPIADAQDGGTFRIRIRVKNSENSRIPSRAP